MQNQKLFVPLLKQAYSIVEDSKLDGLSQMEFARIIGATRLQSRSMLRNLVKTNTITTQMSDIGRQRVTKYVSRKFEKSSELNKQFKEEIDKIKEFTRTMKKGPSKKKNKNDEDKVIREEKFTIQPPPVPVTQVVDPLDISRKRKPNETNSEDNFRQIETITVEETNPEEYVVLDSEAPEQEVESEPVHMDNSIYVNVTMNTNENDLVEEVQEVVMENGILKKKNSRLNKSVYDKIEVKMVVQKPMKIEKDNSAVVGFMEELKTHGEKQTPSITYRLLKRANLIITTVKEQKVISNLAKIRRVYINFLYYFDS